MFTDSHNHTSQFSSDAKMTAPVLLAAAKEAGLGGVVITEHYEKDYPHVLDKPQLFDIGDYFDAFNHWKLIVPDGVSIFSGIEFGYQSHLCAFYDDMAVRYPFDSIIMSCHLFKGRDPFFYPECYQESLESVYSAYIEDMADMVLTCSEFDIVGHYDYIVRYAPYTDPTMKYKTAPESFDRFLMAVIQRKKSLEINTRSIYKLLSKGFKDIWPDRELLERYKELGGERITLGSDSHDPSTLGFYFNETASYLKTCGFDELTTYIGRKEIRTSI